MQKKGTKYPGVKRMGANRFALRGKIVDPRTGQTREVKKVVEALSDKEAAAIRTELMRAAQSGITPTARAKVVDFAKSWIESKAAVVSRYTLEGYVYALDKHVCPILGDHFYDVVGHLEVQGMVNRWLTEKKADDTRRYALRSMKDWFWVFRNMTRDAIAQLGLERDPTLRVSFGEDLVAERAADAAKLGIAEAEQLLEAMRRKRPASHALLETKKLTGQRFCHVSALQWGDIDWGDMVIHFRRKQVRGVVGPISKRKPVPRLIPVLPELASALIAHGRRNGKLGYGVGLTDWVFPSRTGTLKQPSSLRNAIVRTSKEVGLGKRITPHMMRYLFNDVLRLAGVDQVTRKSLTGHVTDEMTEHYSSVQLDEKRAAMEAAAKMLRDGKVYLSVYQGPENEKAA
jgi:integrase